MLKTHLFQIGVDHMLLEPLYLRVGMALVTEHNMSAAGGVGRGRSRMAA